LLEGDAEQVRVARFQSTQDIDNKEAALRGVVQSWIRLKDAG
jgi:hypothetical protein